MNNGIKNTTVKVEDIQTYINNSWKLGRLEKK